MDSSGYTYNMNVYLGKERQRAAQHLTVTYATVTNLTMGNRRIWPQTAHGQLRFLPWPVWWLGKKKNPVVGQWGYIERACPRTSNPRHWEWNRVTTAVVWRDKTDVCLLTSTHDPPREGNYRVEHGNAIKPAIVADYNRHMGHVDNADRMANSYRVSRRT